MTITWDMIRGTERRVPSIDVPAPTRKPVKWCNCLEWEIYAPMGFRVKFISPILDNFKGHEDWCPWCGQHLEEV